MKVSYYPGCSLEGTAVDYAASIAAITPLLDVELEEIADWNCCGATAAHSINYKLSLALPARWLWPKTPAMTWWRPVPCALTV